MQECGFSLIVFFIFHLLLFMLFIFYFLIVLIVANTVYTITEIALSQFVSVDSLH